MLRRTPSGRMTWLRFVGVKPHNDSDPIRISCSRFRRGSVVDFLRLEGLIRMAVAVHANQLSDPAPARMIALAIQNKVDGLGCLGTNERVIEIGSCTQGKIR